jgi:hypothetical protein
LGYAQIDSGVTFGIAHVSFMVDPSAAIGERGLMVGAGTTLSDINGDLIAFEGINGLLNVVPEPSSLVHLSGGLLCNLAYARKRYFVGPVQPTDSPGGLHPPYRGLCVEAVSGQGS